jgi:hypothetical protein
MFYAVVLKKERRYHEYSSNKSKNPGSLEERF